MEQQISMAKSFGIYGFCFYYYWFGEKTLLEKPLKIFLENKHLDINFCLCWANENWTRRWDGQESDILIAQKHSDQDDYAFIENISKYLNDQRYIRINGKPLLLVYRPKLFPNMKKTVKIWREFCREKKIGEICVGMCQTFGDYNPLNYDLDFAVEFPPHNIPANEITSTIKTVDNYSGHIYDGNSLVKKITQSLNKKPLFNWFRGVMMSWDNTARKGLKGHTYVGITPSKFGEWFFKACKFSIKYQKRNERFVFINAWNEWAEGTHLEPCRKMGYSYLNQISRVLTNISYKNGEEKLVSIVVPTFNAEKFIKGALLSIVNQNYPSIEVVIVDDGSIDETRAIIKDFVEENPDVKIVTHYQENQGAHAAINKGVEIATGEILAVCNHDDFFAKKRIEIMVNEMFRAKSELVFSRVKVNILNLGNKDGKKLKQTIENKYFTITEFPNIGYALLDFNVAVSTGNLIFSRNLWKKIGGFQDLKYCHDWMFVLQALNHTMPVFVNKELYEYQVHENNTFRDLTDLAEKETKVVLESFFNERLWTERTKKLFSDRGYFYSFIEKRNYLKYFTKDLSNQENKQSRKYKYYRKGYCPVCQKDSVFLCNEDWLRDFYRCEKCKSLPRDRAIINVLDTYCPSWKDWKMHESSPSNNYFSKLSKNYSFSHFFPNQKLGIFFEGMRNENLEDLTFPDNSFDLIVSLDVLEHIFDPKKAIREMLRVVKLGGNVVFTVPIHKNLNKTFQRASLSSNGELEYLSPPQYHGNPVGDGKSLVTWDYGIDFQDILEKWIDNQNFETKIINKSIEEMGIVGEYLDVIIITRQSKV
ncbi:MAG: glycoside hydrolase family 99-like domain-containing protein [Lutibacter sp.]